jgi:hypothetical protein
MYVISRLRHCRIKFAPVLMCISMNLGAPTGRYDDMTHIDSNANIAQRVFGRERARVRPSLPANGRLTDSED